jgi:phospholipase A1
MKHIVSVVLFIVLFLSPPGVEGSVTPSAREAGEGTGQASKREAGEARSYLSILWEMDTESRRSRFAIVPHNPNYLLPYSYETSPNESVVREAEPGNEVLKNEVKFQISFKTKLWQDVLGRDMDLWAAYTQVSFWQFYNFAGSAPFRETDYEPEILLNFRTDFPVPGLRCRTISTGLNHQSNGRSEPLSRSWNRVVANFGFEKDDIIVVLNAWYRIPEDEDDDDNPEIVKYLGYGRLNVAYRRQGHRFGLSVRNNLRSRANKGSLQLEWSFPLLERVDGYLQYFNGYGESLLDYNASANRIGIGFLLKDW